ncbi:MAG: DUF262 domain-containing protein, partial [Gammaproteobacteria bacterium]
MPVDISPDKQNIDKVFSNTPYHIDFYQRDYRWDDEPVLRLLDDVFYKFNEAYDTHKALDPSDEIIEEKYPWYYLNTYVTNRVSGKVFVVDGQQRLTTLFLILINLYHIACKHNSKLDKWLDNKIAGFTGKGNEFWMNHEDHKPVQQALYEDKPEDADISIGITAENMKNNFLTIRKQLEGHLTSVHKMETFVYYFLRRVVLIDLAVEQTDVPMVFEVINDRGVRLKPFEILKGKLLGQIDKAELDRKEYNKLWDDKIHAINNYAEDEADRFFRFYLKAKFANTRKEGQNFDGDYHRIIFKSEYDERLGLAHNPR